MTFAFMIPRSPPAVQTCSKIVAQLVLSNTRSTQVQVRTQPNTQVIMIVLSLLCQNNLYGYGH